MRHILVEIVCRKCTYHSHIKSHTLVNSQMEPELKERIRQGTMFRYQCPCCHTVIAFIHSFLYHDNKQKLLIGMDLKEQTITALKDQHPDSHLYLVKDPEQLREAVNIIEDHLQLDVIVRLKKQLMKQDVSIQKVIYHDYDRENHMLWFTCQYDIYEQYKAVAYTTYKKMHEYKKGRDRL